MGETNPLLGELREILRHEVRKPIDELDPDLKLSDLGLDSLARVRVLVVIERRYGIEVDEKQAATITKVGDFLDLIESHLSAPAG